MPDPRRHDAQILVEQVGVPAFAEVFKSLGPAVRKRANARCRRGPPPDPILIISTKPSAATRRLASRQCDPRVIVAADLTKAQAILKATRCSAVFIEIGNISPNEPGQRERRCTS